MMSRSSSSDFQPDEDVEMRTSGFDSMSLYTCRAEKKTVTKSGSEWGSEEIEIFRICYKGTRDPYWPKSPPSSQLSSNSLWAGFVDENTDSILCGTNKEIRSHFKELSGFFLALANILRPSTSSKSSTSTRLLERDRKTRQLPPQVSKQALHEFIGSPSVSQSSLESAYDPKLDPNADDDLEEERERKQAEVASSRLAAEFISLVIDVFLDQPVSLKKRLAFRESPTKFILTNEDKTVACKCLDDGSIVWHEFDSESERWRLGKHVCSVETKPGFTQSNEEGKGKISSEMIPQYACELIGAVIQRGTYYIETNINRWQPLIVTHSCYMTILSTTFTPTYFEYITGVGNEVDGDPPSLEIHCTKTHDLKTSVGRRNATKDLLTVCEKLRADNGDKDVGDEESEGEESEGEESEGEESDEEESDAGP